MVATLDDATYDDPYDLGDGVSACYVGWAPDRELNPQYEGVPDEPRYGLIEFHRTPEGEPCSGTVTFDGEVQRRVGGPDRPTWTVESWDPLTLSPSILCQRCGHHGFIREGRWVSA